MKPMLYSFIFCRGSVGLFGQNVIKSRVSYNTPSPLTMEVFICAAYDLISASVMHPGSFNSFIILKCRIRRPIFPRKTGIRATSVFLFFFETWESVGIRAQFCEKYAMFGEVWWPYSKGGTMTFCGVVQLLRSSI